MSGKGEFIHANGDIYEGNFENGQRHGIGKLTSSDGKIYQGEFS